MMFTQGKYIRGVIKKFSVLYSSVIFELKSLSVGRCEILPHPPYSPDMAPSDFYLFPKLKSHLHGSQYGSNEGVIEAVNEYLGDQDQEKAFNFEGLRKLQQRLAKCIALKGDYIEKY